MKSAYTRMYSWFDKLRIAATCVLLTILPSFYNPNLAEPTQTSKTIFFLYLLIVIPALAIPRLIKGNVALRLTIHDALFLLILLYIGFNRYCLQAEYGFSLPFYELAGLSFLYGLLRLHTTETYLYFLLAIIAGGLLQSVQGFLQLVGFFPSYHPDFKITGNFFNPGPYAGFIAIAGVLSSAFLLYRDNLAAFFYRPLARGIVHRSFRYLPLICLISVIVILPSLRSRAAVLSFLGGVSVLAIFKYRKYLRPLHTNMLRSGLIVFVLIILGAGYWAYKFKQDSVDGRLLIYKVTLKIIKAHPIVGVGFDGFKTHYMNAQADWIRARPGLVSKDNILADDTYYAFSEPLQALVEQGLIGFFLLCWFGFICLKTKVNSRSLFLKLLIISSLSSIFLFSLFTYANENLPIKIILITLLALAATIEQRHLLQLDFLQVSSRVVLACAAVVVMFFALSLTTNLKTSFSMLRVAQHRYNEGAYDESVETFKILYPVLQTDGQYLMQYGKALTLAGSHRQAIVILQQAKHYLNNTVIEIALADSYKAIGNYSAAEHFYTRATLMAPGRFYPEYLLAKLYDKAGQKVKAIQKAREIISKKVKIPSKAISEIKAEMQMLINQTSTHN